MFPFFKPNIGKMAAERDFDGLVSLLAHSSPSVRLEAAEALAALNDGRGWRYLLDAVRDNTDEPVQAAAAEILAGLGHQRAVPALEEALRKAKPEAAEAIRAALESLGEQAKPMAPSAGDFLGPAGEPEDYDLRSMLSQITGTFAGGESTDGQFVQPAGTHDLDEARPVEAQPPEVHLSAAADLREAEMQDRALVHAELALWQRPDWAEAWYLRGVLLEDLEREREAVYAYRRALALDDRHAQAREALDELEETLNPPAAELEALLPELHDPDWRTRRDAAAALGEFAAAYPITPGQPAPDFSQALVELLADDEREVRHAAVEAIGRAGLKDAIEALVAQSESSFLLRVSILGALAELGAGEALLERLRAEMGDLQERNPVFTSRRDPTVEMEYDLLQEAGLLALVRAGDVEALVADAEGYAWEEVEEEDEESAVEDAFYDEEDEEVEADEDLLSYVDETGVIAAAALEILAARELARLPAELLRRMAAIPDLTVLDLSDPDAGPLVVHDFSALRERAAGEVKGR